MMLAQKIPFNDAPKKPRFVLSCLAQLVTRNRHVTRIRRCEKNCASGCIKY